MGNKWYKKVEENIAEIKPDTSPFSLGKESGFWLRMASRLTQSRRVHAFFRRFYPIGKIPFTGIYWAFRYSHVREIRDNSGKYFKDIEVFETPYGREMRALLGGNVDAALGMRDGPEYRFFLNTMRAIIHPNDIEETIKPNAKRIAEALVEYSSGEIDAIKDLQTRVSVETCADYFGLTINHPDEFAQWMMSMSAVLFSDPFGDEQMWRTALKGAKNVTDIIDAAFDRTLSMYLAQHGQRGDWPDTLIWRLVKIQQESNQDPALQRPTKEEIRSMMVVLATGWVPTGAAAGGNILEVLLTNQTAMKLAQRAAKSNNDEQLAQCLLEAMRFRPPINPGLPRYASEDVVLERWTLLGKRKTRIKKGEVVMAAAASAMFDGRAKGLKNPSRFDPSRQTPEFSREVDLQFGGFGILHYCIGEEIAKTMLTQSLKPLLRQDRLKRAHGKRGKMRSIGAFPQNLFVTFEPEQTRQQHSIVTITIPLPRDADPDRIDDIDHALDDFGNPADPDLEAALRATEIIHFTHISTIPGTPGDDTRKAHADILLIEICVDGDAERGVEAFVYACGERLEAVLKRADLPHEYEGVRASLLKRSITKIDASPFPLGDKKASGLEFYGTPDLTVRAIERDAAIVSKAREHLDAFLEPNAHRNPAGSEALAYVREALNRDGTHRADLVRPSNSILAINRQGDSAFSTLWGSLATDRDVIGMVAILLSVGAVLGLIPMVTQIFGASLGTGTGASLIVGSIGGSLVATWLGAFWFSRGVKTLPGQEYKRYWKFLGQHKFALLTSFLALSAIAIGGATKYGAIDWGSLSWLGKAESVMALLGAIAGRILIGAIVIVALFAAWLGYAAVLLRRSEVADKGRDIDPDIEHVRKVTGLENPDGFVQNHIVAVTELKTDPRWLRRLTLGFGFFWVEKLVTYLYRPGLIIDMGTIHFARWFRMPGTDKLIFSASYDGSWESYLEDFITKAQWGQTAVWGNGVGFPEVEWLFYKGAGDGARFKRWVRRQQRRTRFWFSRFPALSTDQIRNNSLICEGLAKASTEAQAKAWVDLFGSRPRPAETLEYSEIQSLILKGLAKYRSAELFPIRLPDDDSTSWMSWLNEVSGGDAHNGLVPVSFGEDPTEKTVMTLALSAEGLKRMGLEEKRYTAQGHESNTLASFPEVFVSGMANEARSRILGDRGDSHPDNWRWRSADPETPDWKVSEKPAHAILIYYGEKRTELEQTVIAEKNKLKSQFGFEIGPSIVMQDIPEDLNEFREPFGFRDGISQPVIEGTKRARRETTDLHLVKPGEFILGYPDNRGDFPHSPVVVQSPAQKGDLEKRPENTLNRFPDFNLSGAGQILDFGRNGSFLVMRQLRQYSEEMDTYLKAKAESMNADYPGLSITSEWLAAKMVGRQKNGVSLLVDPAGMSDEDAKPDNDFLFGTEDPQGLKCPYGAHIRRANPRDSLSPKSEYQVEISNRHRLLRRGRTYVSDPARATLGADPSETDNVADGLVFMCFNTDLERQFEFVQQTWMSARVFHGLADERDPIITSTSEPDEVGTFTIPTEFGPIQLRDLPSFVSVLNGGYFFVPSRAALRFLSKMGSA